ncbi:MULTISPECIES: PadR family transcriptional regulator [Salinibaculum]|uniref:PadR family transcriptional regulator n=1 Tax=Salinibaculum TaxID=2732368 RepID=UPI0030CF29CF
MSTDTTTTDSTDTTTTWTDLSAFQRDTLAVLQEIDHEDATSYGLEIKRRLEDLYGEEVNHGRLYPNLDQLVQADLVEKSDLDERTNRYALTHAGKRLLEVQAEHLATLTDICQAEVVADGGQEFVPVHFIAYEDDADLEIDDSGEDPTVANHDELVNSGQTFGEIRMMSREHAEEYDLDVVTQDDALWCDEVADLDIGEAVRVDDLREEGAVS